MNDVAYAPPPPARRLGEARAVREPLRLLWQSRSLKAQRTDRPQPVLLVPGLGASDRSTAPLRRYLTSVGHRPLRWGLGVNGRDLPATLTAFEERVEQAVADVGRPLTLVGWSLGGVVARETARDRPDLVAAVVTYGSPLRGPRFTSASGIYSEAELATIDGFITEREQRPITVPVTAIYSKNDGIVDWRTCVDLLTPGARNIEVQSTHLGMGLDPDVWRAVVVALSDLS